VDVLPFGPGDLIGGRYRLLRPIGAGGMGTVFSARNESTDREFALKLMQPQVARDPTSLTRFFQEAKASGRLRHRCIVEVYDLGRIEGDPGDPRTGTPYLVMELLEGEPVDVLLKRLRVLPWGTALRIVADVARALEVAHQQRIVHRDLKPANLFLHRSLEGRVVPKILDFGVSKLVGRTEEASQTSAGTVVGSPAYMSPEQAAGELDVDRRSDVWSLGVILYRFLSGVQPFKAPNYNALMMMIAREAPPALVERAPELPREVLALVGRCLEKERERRFPTALALAEAIDDVLRAHPDAPSLDLEAVVQAPVELMPDDAQTIASETLAATEVDVDDRARTRVYSGRAGDPTPQPTPAPTTVVTPERRARWAIPVAIAALGVLVGVLVFFATRAPAVVVDAASAPPKEIASANATKETVKEGTSDKPEAVASTSATVVASTSALPKAEPPKTKPDKAAKPATPAPVHEGVTGAGF